MADEKIHLDKLPGAEKLEKSVQTSLFVTFSRDFKDLDELICFLPPKSYINMNEGLVYYVNGEDMKYPIARISG
jgi:hypothetical protein